VAAHEKVGMGSAPDELDLLVQRLAIRRSPVRA
jgi:hypothetical protein